MESNENTMALYNNLRRELLTVERDLAEGRRAYFADGARVPAAVRSMLEARKAALRLELHDLRAVVEEMRDAARKGKGNHFLQRLIARCEEDGRHDLVRAANADSMAWLEQQGLTQAYAARG